MAALLVALTAGTVLPVSACRAGAEVMDEIVVTSERTGPGMWHVHEGSAHVWILGSLSPLPKGIT